MDPCILSIIKSVRLNTLLFKNVLRGIDENSAKKRLGENTNSVAFISLHMLDARYYLLDFLGISFNSEFKEFLSGIKTINDVESFPPLFSIIEDWNNTSDKVLDALSALDKEMLLKKSPVNFPIMDNTILDAVTFLTHHETYHLGQLGILRKHLGFGPMSYDHQSGDAAE